eukprot:3061940-Amphidinium_carterae.1
MCDAEPLFIKLQRVVQQSHSCTGATFPRLTSSQTDHKSYGGPRNGELVRAELSMADRFVEYSEKHSQGCSFNKRCREARRQSQLGLVTVPERCFNNLSRSFESAF